MRSSGFGIGEETSALQYYVYIMLTPGNLCRIALRINFNLVSVYGNAVFAVGHLFIKTTLCRIVFQQVGQYIWLGKVVDGNHFHAFDIVDLAVGQPTNAAKAVDSNFYSTHVNGNKDYKV